MSRVDSAPTSTTSMAARFRVGDLLERLAVPIFLVVLFIWFSANAEIGELFRSSANIHDILANQSVTALMALGMIVPLVAGYFDLSVPAVAGVSNVLMATLLCTYQVSIGVSIAIALAAGLVAGAVTGFLVAGLRLNPFISTLGIFVLLSGLLQMWTGGQTISDGFPRELGDWGAGRYLGIARPFWLLLVVAICLWFMLTQTPYGRRLTAIGSNEVAARLAGIRVDRAVFVSYLISGFLGAMAGVLLTIRNGSADATSAIDYLFPAFSAMFLGQTAFTPGRPNVWGTVFGVFLIAVAVNGLTFMGASGWASDVFSGAVLLLSVAVSTITRRVRDRRSRAAQFEAMRA